MVQKVRNPSISMHARAAEWCRVDIEVFATSGPEEWYVQYCLDVHLMDKAWMIIAIDKTFDGFIIVFACP